MHDRRADKYPYRHDHRADKDSYPHNRNVHTHDLSQSGVNLPIWRLPLRPLDEAAKILIIMNSDFSLLPKAKSSFPITVDACFI